MWTMISPVLRDQRAVVAVEFALVAPVLILLLGTITDYALLTWSRAELASSVAQGGQFAYDAGRSVTATQIAQIVQSAGPLNGVAANVNGPACYCISAGPSLSATACTVPCSDGTTQNYYVSISASYTYSTIMANLLTSIPSKITDISTVRLQ